MNNIEETPSSGSPVIPNQTEAISPIADNNDVSFIYISGEQSFGIFSASYFGTPGFTTPYTPVSIPYPFQTPQNYYIPQFSPLPLELYYPGTNIRIPIKDMTGRQFEAFIQWFFERVRYKATRQKRTHDKGGDVLVEGFGEKIIIQVRHREEHTGIGAVMAIRYAKDKCGADKARIISYSPSVKGLQEENPEVEFWDLGRLLFELRNHGIDYPFA